MTWDTDRGNGILELCHAPDPAKVGERDPQTGLWPVRISHTKPTSPKHEGKHIVTTRTGAVLHILTCERCGKGFKALDEAAKLCRDCKAAESRKRGSRRARERAYNGGGGTQPRSVTIGGRTYPSITQAALSLGVAASTVQRGIKRGGKVAGMQVEAVGGKPIEPRRKLPGNNARRVLVDGVEHESMGAAARAIGCTTAAVREALDKGRGEVKGRKVEEVKA